ncbi:efflux RND transporter periplasmic adaptor subunit [Tateyamaria omphalii]|uniref:efflux RND transporter periplasmic adaptor subunit n=1 Tax=Tateyamaria omphalii TaxID=299262 RepID=UPI001C992FDC|nr:efflux RND transporter periplasmic adaptor subunit [Tateyamaria omphalii]MBY5934943.1 efflux RND transporter periplasmic adaptor subunit [Tateyamaria omphalii]
MFRCTGFASRFLEFRLVNSDKVKRRDRVRTDGLPVNFLKTLVLMLAIVTGFSVRAAEGQDAPRLVKTIVTDQVEASVQRTFFGQIAARETVDLGFQVDGRIVDLKAPEGELLPRGTRIAQLDQEPFEIEVERARLALEQSERTLNRFNRLSGSTVSEAQVLDAQTEVNLARVALRNAEYALEQTEIFAPFDAVVAARHVANFSTIAAGTQIVRLHDLSALQVDIDVPEVLVQELGEDPDVTLTARLQGQDTEYPLAFREVNAETSQVGQTFRVTLTLDPPQGRLLLPGASVTVHARLNGMAEGIPVPPSAVGLDPNGTKFVMLVEDQDGAVVVRRQDVSVGVAASGDILITDGLAHGAEIVVAGVGSLRSGDAIRRFSADFD